jgi:hypothetical protein
MKFSARLNEPPRPAIRRYQPAAMRSPLLDELTAIHEAGHAVVAHVHDRPIHSAALTDGGGEFRHHSDQPIDEAGLLDAIVSGLEPSPSARDTWRSSLIEVAAGRAAERKFGATQDFYDANGSHDRGKLVAVACAVTDSDAESLAYIAEIEAEAARLVDEHWAAIQAVARALHAAGSLDEAKIRAAINSADIENAKEDNMATFST